MKKVLALSLIFCCIGLTSCSKKEESAQVNKKPTVNNQIKGFSYNDFKREFQIGALQYGVPFTLADSLIQEGEKASSMQVLFTDNSDMTLYMTPSDHIIKEISVYVSGNVTNGVFDDAAYALAVIWALEGFKNTQDCGKFASSFLDVTTPVTSESGFRYSHPELTGKSISFTAVNTKL